jgi:hypothetical protein
MVRQETMRPDGFEETILAPGLRKIISPQAVTFLVDTSKCGLSIGRILIFVAASLFFFTLAVLLGLAGFSFDTTEGRFVAIVFSVFFGSGAIGAFYSVIFALASETIVVSEREFIRIKQIGPLRRQKEVAIKSIEAIVLNRFGEPYGEAESIETLSIVYRKKWRFEGRLIVGYALNKQYRTILFDAIRSAVKLENTQVSS